LFEEFWVPTAVVAELQEGRQYGYAVPDFSIMSWLKVVEPRAIPAEWRALDLGRGELAAMATSLENPGRIVLLDNALARRTAQKAGLQVWGTLKILIEAKSCGIVETIKPWVQRLSDSGLWFSDDLRTRVLALAGESLD
jgi:predicted nucleic acid-binding protein